VSHRRHRPRTRRRGAALALLRRKRRLSSRRTNRNLQQPLRRRSRLCPNGAPTVIYDSRYGADRIFLCHPCKRLHSSVILGQALRRPRIQWIARSATPHSRTDAASRRNIVTQGAQRLAFVLSRWSLRAHAMDSRFVATLLTRMTKECTRTSREWQRRNRRMGMRQLNLGWRAVGTETRPAS
jgi:hypothetical protein